MGLPIERVPFRAYGNMTGKVRQMENVALRRAFQRNLVGLCRSSRSRDIRIQIFGTEFTFGHTTGQGGGAKIWNLSQVLLLWPRSRSPNVIEIVRGEGNSSMAIQAGPFFADPPGMKTGYSCKLWQDVTAVRIFYVWSREAKAVCTYSSDFQRATSNRDWKVDD